MHFVKYNVIFYFFGIPPLEMSNRLFVRSIRWKCRITGTAWYHLIVCINHTCCISGYYMDSIGSSVKPNFVYLPEVVEYPNNNKRCDAPHFIQMRGTTRLLWRHPYKMKSAVRCPVILKLPHFRQGQCENTFLCLCRRCFDLQHNKDINIFANKQHSTGHRRVFNLYVTANSI